MSEEKKKLVCPMCMQNVDERHMCCGPLIETVKEVVKEVIEKVIDDKDEK